MAESGGERQGGDADFEAALAECIQRLTREGAAGVDQVCAGRPELERRLRERLAALARLGLLGGEREDALPAAFGRYEILRSLGRGGMAVVYQARDRESGELVALKAAAMPWPDDRRERARFEREVRAFEGLRHPNVVPILDSGEEHGRPYFTMEYVEGATLADVIRALRDSGRELAELTGRDIGRIALGVLAARGELEPQSPADAPRDPEGPWSRSYFETVSRIVLQVAEALDHVHAHGVLHRDVKPSNILLRRDGRALLFDLGLAHVDGQPALTRSGDFAGTPYYVSPEQVSSGAKELDPRSDVYSLGVTLFELLTLRRPFEGRTTAQVLRAIASEEAPFPRRLNPLVPRDLETICLAALEKDPAQRTASAGELALDLRRFLAYQPVSARSLSAPRRLGRLVRRHPARASALGLAGLLVVGLPVGLFLANAAIRAQRDLAARSADDARREVARNARQIDFLVQLFDSAGAEALDGEAQSASDVLARSAERIDAQFEEEPLVRAALMEATGRVYADLGMHQRALYQLDRSFAILQAELGPHHHDVAAALEGLAAVHLAQGNAPAAEALARRALAAIAGAASGDPALELEVRRTLSDALVAEGRAREAAAVLLAAPAGGAGEARAAIEERLGRLAVERGEPLEARARLEDALALRESVLDPDVPEIAHNLEALADVAARAGDPSRAADLRRRAGELRASWFAPATWASADPLGAGPAASGRAELFSRFLLLPEWIADFDRAFQEGITALQSGRPREAIELFGRCHVWQPERPACAYNTACAFALLGESASALDWLERAAELGFAADDVGWDTLHKDPDLDSIRGEARLERVVERAQSLRERVDAQQRESAFRAPRSPHAGPWPLLVVLHAHGEDGAAVLAGPWAQAADELGCALLAPSAPLPAGEDPARGMKWFEDVRELVERPNRHGQRILDLVDEALERHDLDGERVFLAGAGEAAPLAFDLALRAPGRFRGVLLVDGTILPEVALDRCRRAAAFGLAVRVAIASPEHLAGEPGPEALAQHALDVEGWLAQRGLEVEVELPGRGATAAERLAGSLEALLEAPAAVLR